MESQLNCLKTKYDTYSRIEKTKVTTIAENGLGKDKILDFIEQLNLQYQENTNNQNTSV